jgi:sulfur-oxidizing protein SoxX
VLLPFINLSDICLALITLAMMTILLFSGPAYGEEDGMQRLERGKQLAMAKSSGNCLACHAIEDGGFPGNIGPPLMSMQARFPDKAVLRAQIWDPTERNPDSHMPPFGLHGILTGEEIDLIVDYLYTL